MGNRFWTVVGYDHNGNGEASKKFWSMNAAQDQALEQLQAYPDKYAEVFIMECSQMLMSVYGKEEPAYVHSGPEYVRRSLSNSNDGDRLQLEHRGNEGG